jgi:hypothetical protein
MKKNLTIGIVIIALALIAFIPWEIKEENELLKRMLKVSVHKVLV